jgi:TolB-like protein
LTTDLGGRLEKALGGKYVIERELGGGGMSRVFLAEDVTLARKVVIKVLPPELAADISGERFAREIKISAQLQHPQIVSLLSAGDADGLPYYLMPYVEGEGLRDRISREGKFPIRDVIAILRDVAKALAFAHSRNVVHRDIKPENVLLTGDSAVVADFGISKAIGAARTHDGIAPATLTQVGTSIGTPAYMAPEQAAGDPDTDSRADIYSFGCLGYEMLTGVAPFVRDTVHRTVAAHISEQARPVSELRPDCPRSLAALVMRCLEKDPKDRPQSGGELIRALDEVNLTPPGGFPSFVVGRKLPLVAGIVAVLLLAGFFVVRMRSGSRPSPAIAVLPFKNIGGDSSAAYFGQGIAEELAFSLQKIPGLQVTSQTSAAAVQAKGLTIQDIGKALGVGTVLEGSVQRQGDHLHLTASLSNTSDGRVIWTQPFDRDAKDLFGIQTDLVNAIVQALELRLTDAARANSVRGTNDPVAYDYYLQGRYAITQGYRTAGAMSSAAMLFQKAIDKDSNFARAYSGYSDAESLLPFFSGAPFDSVSRLMKPAARKAIALDPSLGEAHASLARAFSYDGFRDSAEAEYKTALKLDPEYASAEQWYSSVLCSEGRISECLTHSQKAAELDPMNAAFVYYYASTQMLVGRATDADSTFQRALALDSGILRSPTAREFLLDRGKYEDVVRVGEKYKTPWGEVVYALAKLGRRSEADSVLKEVRAHEQKSLVDQVVASLGVGDTAAALNALDQESKAPHPRSTGRTLSDPIYDPIRSSPRFAAFVRSLGFNPAVLATGKGGRP